MDENQLATYALQCVHLKHKFSGVYAANNSPRLQRNNSFQILNASPANTEGSHWVLLCKRGDGEIVFADPLGFSLTSYMTLHKHCIRHYSAITIFSYPIQPLKSSSCGLYCLYLAHIILNGTIYPNLILVDEYGLKRFVNHMY
jgi:hypothetical protein